MNIYRITFFADGGVRFKTILKADTLDQVNDIVLNTINYDSGLFEVEGKHNRHFKVNQTSYSFIEYELVFANSTISFEEISKLDINSLTKIVNSIENNDVFAVAFHEAPYQTITNFYTAIPITRQEIILEAIENMWELTTYEVIEARQMIIDVALSLSESGEIQLISNR